MSDKQRWKSVAEKYSRLASTIEEHLKTESFCMACGSQHIEKYVMDIMDEKCEFCDIYHGCTQCPVVKVFHLPCLSNEYAELVRRLKTGQWYKASLTAKYIAEEARKWSA